MDKTQVINELVENQYRTDFSVWFSETAKNVAIQLEKSQDAALWKA